MEHEGHGMRSDDDNNTGTVIVIVVATLLAIPCVSVVFLVFWAIVLQGMTS